MLSTSVLDSFVNEAPELGSLVWGQLSRVSRETQLGLAGVPGTGNSKRGSLVISRGSPASGMICSPSRGGNHHIPCA